MDIKLILNVSGPNGAATAAVAATAATNDAARDLHLFQSISHANSFPLWETGSERGTSSPGSEHSRCHTPGLFGQRKGFNEAPNIRHPSPAAIQDDPPILQQNHGCDNVYVIGVMRQDDGDGSGPQLPGDGVALKVFPCSTCGKSFARRSDLSRHEWIHSGVRPYICGFTGCNRQFIQRSALTIHCRVHTGEKPYTCEGCGKHFSDSSILAKHRRTHHAQTARRPRAVLPKPPAL